MVIDESELLAKEGESTTADATIVIPQHDRTALTLSAVRALRRWEMRCWPIVVVDDGSNPIAAAELEQLSGDVVLLRQPHHGVTAAWNSALRHVGTPLVVLLNNDVLIEGAWVDRLVQPLRSSVCMLSGVELRHEQAVPPAVLDRLGRSRFVAGWCWAFRVSDFRALGGFDESLRLYFSDTDLQARLLGRASPTADPVIVTSLSLQHLGHASTRSLTSRRAQWRADRARFIAKWMGDRQ
jgi:GT2 family glycosyltransferase